MIDIPAEEELPKADELAMVTYTGPAGQPATDQLDAVVDLDGTVDQPSQLDAVVDGAAFSGPVAKLVA